MSKLTAIISWVWGQRVSRASRRPDPCTTMQGEAPRHDFLIGSRGVGRKGPLTQIIDGTGARPGETVAIDHTGHARVLGRRPELVVRNDNLKAE